MAPHICHSAEIPHLPNQFVTVLKRKSEILSLGTPPPAHLGHKWFCRVQSFALPLQQTSRLNNRVSFSRPKLTGVLSPAWFRMLQRISSDRTGDEFGVVCLS